MFSFVNNVSCFLTAKGKKTIDWFSIFLYMLKIFKRFPFKSNFTIYYPLYSLVSENYLIVGKMPKNNLIMMTEIES